MHTSYTTVLSLLLSACAASPMPRADFNCDKPPAGPDMSVKPLSQPPANTADLCIQACQANSQCQSCAFGLPPSKETSLCMLFGVPGARIPPQETEIHVFDRGCTEVPTEPPTHEKPRGPPRGYSSGQPGSGISTGGKDQPEPGKFISHGQGPDTRERGHETPAESSQAPPTNSRQTKPVSGKPVGGHAGNDADCDDNSVPSEPKQQHKRMPGGQQTRHDIKPINSRKDECSITPRGPANSKPAPIKTHTGIGTLPACLEVCKKTSGCQSCEFGKQKPGGPQECRLFQVPVSSLPLPPKGASVVGSNAGC